MIMTHFKTQRYFGEDAKEEDRMQEESGPFTFVRKEQFMSKGSTELDEGTKRYLEENDDLTESESQ